MMFARTKRLLLRPGWIEDAPALTRAVTDGRIARAVATIPCPYTPDDAHAFLAMPQPARLPRMLIFERGDAAPDLIGGIGLTGRVDRPSIGYWIRPDRWGHGIATEAGEAMLAIADMLGHAELHATYFLDNPASGAVLRKLGFAATGNIRLCTSLGRSDPALCREMRRAVGVGTPATPPALIEPCRHHCQKRIIA